MITPAISSAMQQSRLHQDLKNLAATETLTTKQGTTESIKQLEALARIKQIREQTRLTANAADVSNIPASAANKATSVLTSGVRIGGEGGFTDKASTAINDFVDLITNREYGHAGIFKKEYTSAQSLKRQRAKAKQDWLQEFKRLNKRVATPSEIRKLYRPAHD